GGVQGPYTAMQLGIAQWVISPVPSPYETRAQLSSTGASGSRTVTSNVTSSPGLGDEGVVLTSTVKGWLGAGGGSQWNGPHAGLVLLRQTRVVVGLRGTVVGGTRGGVLVVVTWLVVVTSVVVVTSPVVLV